MFPIQSNTEDTSKLYVDDVFSTYLYTGNSTSGGTQTIATGIDLSTNKGLVWIKGRSAGSWNVLFDTLRGAGLTNNINRALSSNTTNAQDIDGSPHDYLSAFSSTGFTVTQGGTSEASRGANYNGVTYAAWTFRKAPKFFDVQTVIKLVGISTNISFSDLGTLGMVVVKRTDSTGDWFVWHKSLSAGKLLYLNQTAAEATLGHVTVSGTTVTLVNGVIADGSYVVYAWAHDTASDGLIQCGSFTTDGSGNATVNLGWEPQFILLKNINSINNQNWIMQDTFRGFLGDSTNPGASLYANSSAAEISQYNAATSTGFNAAGYGVGGVWVYLAIRRHNKPPTTGTQVFNAVARTGTGAATTSTAGFPVDLVITKKRSSTTLTGAKWVDRLRGKTYALDSTVTSAQALVSGGVTALDSMTTVSIGTDGSYNTNTHTYIDWFFRRYPGIFETVVYLGPGSSTTVSHNLGVSPEFMIVKAVDNTRGWTVYHAGTGANKYSVLSALAAPTTDTTVWNNTSPGLSSFSIGTSTLTNESGFTYVAYLFATKAGISKVGSYTGNGTSQTINCGFTTGARFVMIKRTDSNGNWYVFDTTRGIVAGNDPFLYMNSTAAEVTGFDAIDPDNSGFIVNNDATNFPINVNTATYIYLALA